MRPVDIAAMAAIIHAASMYRDSLTELNQQLEAARLATEERRTLQERREQARIRRQQVEDTRERLAAVLARQERALASLQEHGLASQVLRLLGLAGRRRARAQRQTRAAQLTHDEAAAECQALDDELAALDRRLAELADAEERYAHCLARKQAHLLARGGALASDLSHVVEETARSAERLEVLSLAIDIGEQTLQALDELAGALRASRGRGGPGGPAGIFRWLASRWSSQAREAMRDHARNQAHLAQQLIWAFQRRAGIIGKPFTGQLQDAALDRFTPLWLALVTTPVWTRSNVAAWLRAVDSIATALLAIFEQLVADREVQTRRLEQLREQQRAMITAAQ